MVRFSVRRIGEIILGRIVCEVGKRQHNEGEMRWLEQARRGDGRGAVSPEERCHVPPATATSATIPAISGKSIERFFGP